MNFLNKLFGRGSSKEKDDEESSGELEVPSPGSLENSEEDTAEGKNQGKDSEEEIIEEEYSKIEKEKKEEKKEEIKKSLKEKTRNLFKREKKSIFSKQKLREYFYKAGFSDVNVRKVKRNIKIFSFLISLLLIIYLVFVSLFFRNALPELLDLFLIFVVSVAFFWLLISVSLFFYLDLKIFNRTKEVEKVLPDFLQLVSANISAGMPLDRALWRAVRPRFGVLASEVEVVAKSTITGEELNTALTKFSDKYNSKILKKSISLLIEGREAGGELASLISKISSNIQENKILKREMSATVMTYAIFITFAAIVIAPFLFGLATQLLDIVIQIGNKVELGNISFFSVQLVSDPTAVSNFKIFSVVMLTITSLLSACIISVIRRGKIMHGVKFIPLFVLVALALYFLAVEILANTLGTFI